MFDQEEQQALKILDPYVGQDCIKTERKIPEFLNEEMDFELDLRSEMITILWTQMDEQAVSLTQDMFDLEGLHHHQILEHFVLLVFIQMGQKTPVFLNEVIVLEQEQKNEMMEIV